MSGFSRSALVDIARSRLKADIQQRPGALGAAWFLNENGMNAKPVQAQPFTTTGRGSDEPWLAAANRLDGVSTLPKSGFVRQTLSRG